MPDSLNFFHLLAALAFVAGLCCDVFLAQRFANARQFRVGFKSWGMRELGIAAFIVIGVLLIANVGYGLFAQLSHRDFDELAPFILPAELVLRVVVLAGFLVFFRQKQIPLIPALGLDTVTPLRAIGWGTVFGLASLPPVGLVLLGSDALCRYLGIDPSQQPIVELFAATDSVTLLVTLVIFALVVAPVFEEFFFRGFAYPALKQRLGAPRAMVIVSAAFAASHGHAPSFIPLFALALGLGLAYELTGSLLTSISMHALFNGLMTVRLFYERSST